MCISSFYFVCVFWLGQYGLCKGQSWGLWLQKSLVDIIIIRTILLVLLVQKQSCQDEEHPNFSLFSLCVTVSSCFFPKAEKLASLKSGISLQQRNVWLNSRRNIFVMLPIIVYLVYHYQAISATELLLFWSWKWRHENALHNMASLSSYLARRVRKMTGILSSDWWRERAVRVCQVMCPPGITRFLYRKYL